MRSVPFADGAVECHFPQLFKRLQKCDKNIVIGFHVVIVDLLVVPWIWFNSRRCHGGTPTNWGLASVLMGTMTFGVIAGGIVGIDVCFAREG
jgi:hypothetical protein